MATRWSALPITTTWLDRCCHLSNIVTLFSHYFLPKKLPVSFVRTFDVVFHITRNESVEGNQGVTSAEFSQRLPKIYLAKTAIYQHMLPRHKYFMKILFAQLYKKCNSIRNSCTDVKFMWHIAIISLVFGRKLLWHNLVNLIFFTNPYYFYRLLTNLKSWKWQN